MTTQAAYKKRLKQHLSETKRHGRDVKKRVKELGGVAGHHSIRPAPRLSPDAAQAVLSGAQKAAALAQGPLHALRGTGEEEKQLKNAKTEYASESEEIATYSAIEALAETLGDGDTQRLARGIRRDEERMRSYLGEADSASRRRRWPRRRSPLRNAGPPRVPKRPLLAGRERRVGTGTQAKGGRTP